MIFLEQSRVIYTPLAQETEMIEAKKKLRIKISEKRIKLDKSLQV